MMGGLTDPISLTHFGLPFGTSGKILGIEADVIYSPGATTIGGTGIRELGSCVIELLKPKPGYENAEFRYHGGYPDRDAHSANNAEPVAHARARLGNSSGTAWDGTGIKVVSAAEWTAIQVLFDYENGEMPEFTHLHIVFASSSRGDLFEGVVGSTLKVDNVRILYEKEE
jgi:hypothetical protein